MLCPQTQYSCDIILIHYWATEININFGSGFEGHFWSSYTYLLHTLISHNFIPILKTEKYTDSLITMLISIVLTLFFIYHTNGFSLSLCQVNYGEVFPPARHYGDCRAQSNIVLGNTHAGWNTCILSEYWCLNLSVLPCESKCLMTEWPLIIQGT